LGFSRVGEIIVLDTAKMNGEIGKQQLAVILSAEGGKETDYMVADVIDGIPAQRESPYLIRIDSKDLENGEMEKTVFIRVDKISTVNQNCFFKTGIAKIGKEKQKEVLRKWAQLVTTNYYKSIHQPEQERPFDSQKSRVFYAGRVFDENEIVKLVDSSLDFWLTEGRYSEEFSEKIADFLDVDNVFLTNSGSSSNLLAISALTSKKLGKRRLSPGDEVITAAAGFPATVTPIIQNNLIPVFVDIDVPTYNINIESLKKAIGPKTKAIFLAHTLGNPFNLKEVIKIAKENNLWVVEDNCDAFGSQYDGKYTGTFGDISTISFYPAHHITTGEGGAVVTNNDELGTIVKSFRDWGRDCYCAGGENNTCGKRFTQQFGTLPFGYDHKYVYSEIGYNLKMTEMSAAIGSAQMDKLEMFCNQRRENFKQYNKELSNYTKYLILPEATPNSDPAWFTYIISVKEDAPFSRNEMVSYLNDNRIETRNIFAGNMIRQPAFTDQNYRVAGELTNTDFVMNNTYFLGTFPGMSREKIVYTCDVMKNFMDRY
jgi:CDP-4-dehydro-6-deoxyglucose reductase, E1